MISDKKRKWRRINGLSLPLDGFQIIAWIFTLLFTLVYFGAIVQSFPNEQCQLVLIILMAILLFIHIFLHISCNFVDPADPAVRAKKQIQPLPNFNRKKHLRVIENQFCNICEVKVGSKSKHCSSCNKCIDGFDHHCKWLNNCVGKRNYKLFLSCISTALACILLVLVASIICVIRAVKKTSWMCSVQQETISTNATNINQDIANSSSIVNIHYVILVPVTKNLWLAVIIITLVLTVIALGLLIHLLGFHLVLICKGFSTYEYIMQHRNSDEERNSGSLATSVAKKCSLSQNNKRISPHKPSSLENSNPSLHRSKPITMYKLNGVAQTKKETLSVSKEGLCSSGDVYIGSPAKTLRNNSIHSANLSQIHQNEGFVVDYKPQVNNVTKVSVKPTSNIDDNVDHETTFCDNENPVDENEPPRLKSRSPSLNNLMINEDVEATEECVFDNIENCMDNQDEEKAFRCESPNISEKEKYLNRSQYEFPTYHCQNNNNENDKFSELAYQFQGDLPKIIREDPSIQTQCSRSLSMDNYELSKANDESNLINKRRCSVEIHNLNAGTCAQTSLTPVDSSFVQEKRSSQEQRRRQPNHSVPQSIHSHIV